MNEIEYREKVFEELESFDYPSMIQEFNEVQVAFSLASTMHTHWKMQVSPMKCAIIIFSLTWNYQIIPSIKNSTKH